MSDETEGLRGKLDERREQLARLRRDESTCSKTIEVMEQQLTQQRRRQELLRRRIGTEEQAVEAVEAALTVLTERLPSEVVLDEELTRDLPEVPALLPPAKGKEKTAVALRILRDAETIDLGNVSQRSRDRAEKVREILGSEQSLLREEVVREMLSVEPTESKARTAVDVGLAVLVAEGRVRCAVPSTDDRWELTPPERASGNLGIQIQDFAGRTTRWPTETSSPPTGTLIRQESGAYESGKRR